MIADTFHRKVTVVIKATSAERKEKFIMGAGNTEARTFILQSQSNSLKGLLMQIRTN